MTQEDLAERIRRLLAEEPEVQEMPMFGGLAFMVDDRLLVSVGEDGSLLVRADPERHQEFLDRGASRAQLGGGSMGKAWLRIRPGLLTSEEDLGYWVEAARDFRRRGF